MKKLIQILLIISSSLFFTKEVLSLTNCSGADSSFWNNCFGSLTFPDGRQYDGEFKDGLFDGNGVITHLDGEKYVGEFKDDIANGQGTNTFLDGQKYVGTFKDGKRNGQGTITLPGGDKYVGEFEDDLPNDQGIWTFSEKTKQLARECMVKNYKDC